MSKRPDLSSRKEARNERLARALRDNLKRRKEQARAHAAAANGDASDPSATLSEEALSSKSNNSGGTIAD
jgi:hypothetical protein